MASEGLVLMLQFKINEKISLFRDIFGFKILTKLIKMHKKTRYLNNKNI